MLRHSSLRIIIKYAHTTFKHFLLSLSEISMLKNIGEKTKFSISTIIIKHLDLLSSYKLYQLIGHFMRYLAIRHKYSAFGTITQREGNCDPTKTSLTTVVYQGLPMELEQINQLS